MEDDIGDSPVIGQIPNFFDVKHGTTLDRSSSDQSTGSLLYGKTPTSGALLGKSSSLIFPTGVDSSTDVDSESAKVKRRKINLALDQCEAVRFRFKKKLILSNLDLRAADIPLKDLCGTFLGNSLHKLSLAGNRLGTVPAKLVVSLPILKTLDLSQCDLTQLPDKWNLPKLTHLNLSHNGFTEFPEEVRFVNGDDGLCRFIRPYSTHTYTTHRHCTSRGRVCWKDYQNCRTLICMETR
jgi:Leucine-rich repeat (LRR) protein